MNLKIKFIRQSTVSEGDVDHHVFQFFAFLSNQFGNQESKVKKNFQFSLILSVSN